MIVNFAEIDILNIDYGGGNVYYYNDELFSGTIVEYNENGILVSEITVLDGSKHGMFNLYYDSGRIESQYFENDNRTYGISRKWDESGNLIYEHDFGSEINHSILYKYKSPLARASVSCRYRYIT